MGKPTMKRLRMADPTTILVSRSQRDVIEKARSALIWKGVNALGKYRLHAQEQIGTDSFTYGGVVAIGAALILDILKENGDDTK